MDIRELRYVIAIADEGTLTRAADRLHVSRQAAAKALRSVEDEVGDHLFERRGTQLTPTERGAVFVADARKVVDAFDELCRLHLARPSGSVSSGLPREALSIALVVRGGSLLNELLDQFSRLNPRTVLHVEEMSSDSVLASVAGGNSDVGLVGSHPTLLGGFESCFIRPSGIWLIVPDDMPLAYKKVAHVQDLDGVPIVTTGEHNHVHRFVFSRCEAAGVMPYVCATATEDSMVAALCRKHHAVSFGFPPDLAPAGTGAKTVRLRIPDDQSFGTYLIRRRQVAGLAASPSAKRLWKLAATIATPDLQLPSTDNH